MTKKIVIDAYQDTATITGTDRMAFNFLCELQKIDTTNSYAIICSNETYQQSAVNAPNFRVIKPPLDFSNTRLKRVFNFVWRRGNSLRFYLLKPDVYYSFHNMRLPKIRTAKKMVASNLDLIPIILDEYKGLGRLSIDQQYKMFHQVAENADHIVSISEFSKRELAKTLQVSERKISVVYLAADKAMQSGKSARLPKAINPKQKYIFTMGGSEPRKNVQNVITAYEMLPNALRSQFKLVIAGGKWNNQELTIKDSGVMQLGYVADESLPALYTNASAFVFASKYEGFGFTILEAMACGAPVINASGSSLDEVAGNATLSFTTDDPDDLKNKMVELLGSPELQKKLVERGFEQNKKFSWDKAGQQLHKILTTS